MVVHVGRAGKSDNQLQGVGRLAYNGGAFAYMLCTSFGCCPMLYEHPHRCLEIYIGPQHHKEAADSEAHRGGEGVQMQSVLHASTIIPPEPFGTAVTSQYLNSERKVLGLRLTSTEQACERIGRVGIQQQRSFVDTPTHISQPNKQNNSSFSCSLFFCFFGPPNKQQYTDCREGNATTAKDSPVPSSQTPPVGRPWRSPP